MSDPERVRAELEVLGLDATRHVVDFYAPFLAALGVTRACDLVRCRAHADVLVAGLKVATQTPPVRSGRRVVFVTLDDATGPVDATFFEDAQASAAATLFHAWLLVIRGFVRLTGPRGAPSRSTRPVIVSPPLVGEGAVGRSRYADVRLAGATVAGAPRKLWHASPGS